MVKGMYLVKRMFLFLGFRYHWGGGGGGGWGGLSGCFWGKDISGFKMIYLGLRYHWVYDISGVKGTYVTGLRQYLCGKRMSLD